MTGTGQRILLVDDDPHLLRLLTIRLQSVGYQVTAVESGEKALAALTAARPHLVITDLRMGGMDGLTLFDAVHRSFPTLPVIVLTAHGNIRDAVAATQRGVFGYLTKPFEASELLEQVAKALSMSSGLSAHQPAPGDQSWREDIVTCSPLIEDLLSQAQLVAAGDASVFIYGESGSGKELLARAIHKASPRAQSPFVAVNCGAIPEQLLESELFGHVKGSFTGATRDHNGLFQAAHHGTLFLDEIGDMPLPLQVKLLRVLEAREVRPVGSTRFIPIDVRVISATHRDLDALKTSGNFRQDLFYRLNVVSLSVPSLTQRREDIPLLASHFLARLSRKYQKQVAAFSPEALEVLTQAAWPGNVRQLNNVVEQTVALSTGTIIPASLVQNALAQELAEITSFEVARTRFEREYLARLLKITGGNVSQAAKLAKRNRTEFYKLLQRLDLDPALFKRPRA